MVSFVVHFAHGISFNFELPEKEFELFEAWVDGTGQKNTMDVPRGAGYVKLNRDFICAVEVEIRL